MAPSRSFLPVEFWLTSRLIDAARFLPERNELGLGTAATKALASTGPNTRDRHESPANLGGRALAIEHALSRACLFAPVQAGEIFGPPGSPISRLILAAIMKSFSCSPLIFFVCSDTVARPQPKLISG